MITLRPYQEQARDQIREALRTHRAVLYCLPCGGGKGSLCSVMVHGAVQRGRHVVFAVHGKALVNDMSSRVSRLGIEHGVLMGGRSRQRWHPVQVASIDTLHRMQHKPKCELLIVDEARTFLSKTARKVIDEYPNAKIVGLDATPLRGDSKGLGVQAGGIFDVMVMGPTEQELIDLDFLVPSIPIGIPNPPDVRKVKKVGGEFSNKELADACKSATRVGDIVQHWLREAPGRKTIAFGIDRADALDITEQFVKAGIKWAYVDANTPDEERKKIWNDIEFGDLMGFSNVAIAGCGFDLPIISCIISAAPRNCLSTWRQEIGRGSRVHRASGKKNFIILDHSGNLAAHHPFGYFEVAPEWTLEGGRPKEKDADNAPRVATCKVPVRVPDTGVPASFRGPVSPDGKYMLGSYHTFRAGPTECPYCGLPLKFEGRKIDVVAGDLENLEAERERARLEAAKVKPKSPFQLAYEERMKAAYLELRQTAMTRNYKSGWADTQFNCKYHRWPTKAWKDEAEKLTMEEEAFYV